MTPMTYEKHEITRQLSRAAAAGMRWRIRLEYIGWNPETKSKRSMKFWKLQATGQGEVMVAWGKIGSNGQSKPTYHGDAMGRMRKKLDEGYSIVKLDYVEQGLEFGVEVPESEKTEFSQSDGAFAQRREAALEALK